MLVVALKVDIESLAMEMSTAFNLVLFPDFFNLLNIPFKGLS